MIISFESRFWHIITFMEISRSAENGFADTIFIDILSFI